jgi:hypothetical protein
VSNDHHERGVRLVEVREVVECRDLPERPEIRDRRSSAERDDHPTVDALRERLAARDEFSLRNLRRGDPRRGDD